MRPSKIEVAASEFMKMVAFPLRQILKTTLNNSGIEKKLKIIFHVLSEL